MKRTDTTVRPLAMVTPHVAEAWEERGNGSWATLVELESQQINGFSCGLYDGLHGMEVLVPYSTRADGGVFRK